MTGPMTPHANLPRASTCATGRSPGPANGADLFDSKAGEGAVALRKLWASTLQSECVAKLGVVLQSASAYTGPEAEVLCALKPLGLF